MKNSRRNRSENFPFYPLFDLPLFVSKSQILFERFERNYITNFADNCQTSYFLSSIEIEQYKKYYSQRK